MDEMKIPEPQSRKEYFLRKIAYPDAPCPAPETREEEYLDAIAQNKGGGGEPSGDGGVFVVTFTLNENTQEVTCDKTFAEIQSAVNSGKYPAGKLVNSGLTIAGKMLVNDVSVGGEFSAIVRVGDTGMMQIIQTAIDNTDTVTMGVYGVQLLVQG